MSETVAPNRFGHWGSDNPNPNLALAQIRIKIEPEEIPIEEFFGDVQYTDHEKENLEAYYITATAIVYLKTGSSLFQVVELSESVGGVTVFSWDHSYLKESAMELVEEIQTDIEALGVPPGTESLDQYVAFDYEPLPSPTEAFSDSGYRTKIVDAGTINTGKGRFPMIDFGGK